MLRHLTFRRRLVLFYTGIYFAISAVLVGISYTVVSSRLRAEPANAPGPEFFEQLGIESPGQLPPQAALEDLGITRTILEQLRDDVVADTLETLVLWSLLAAVALAAIAVPLGILTTNRILAPVRQVTETAQRSSETNLDERVNISGPPDELTALADTFDAMLDRLQNAVDSQRQFSALASHELRTPLSRIRTAAEVARVDPDDTTVTELAGIVEPAAIEAAALVDRLLQLARSQAGLKNVEPIDIQAVWHTTTGEAATLAADAGVNVDVDGPPATITGDRTLIMSMARNILENAIRHNHRGGHVHVTWRNAADRVLITATNTGPRISEADIARMTQPFQRHRSNPDGLGHGLGTTIIRTIARAHHGTTTIQPNPPGGLAVTVDLPNQPTQ